MRCVRQGRPLRGRSAAAQRSTRAELLDAPVRWPVPAVLDADLTHLKGVGPKLAEAAAELGIEDLGDLLRHIPHTYRDAAAPMGIGDLRLGEEATVEVKVLSAAKQRPTRRRGLRILEAHVGDASGSATATWFNRGWLADRLQPGTRLLLRGKLSGYGFNVTEHEIVGSGDGGLGRDPHDRDGPRPPGLREAAPAAPARVGMAGGERRPQRDRADPGAGARRARDARRRPTPWSRRTSRPTSARRWPPAAASPSRSCCSTRPRSPPAARAAARAGPRGRSTRRARWCPAGSTRCRST